MRRLTPPICDYEGSRYQTDFWAGQGRAYEDAAERIALNRLLPPRGRRLIEIGAGFGRLADLYQGYDEVILLDYAKSQLRQAQAYLGDDGFTFVAGDLYNLPLADAALDTVVTVRVLHHVKDLAAAFAQIGRVLRPGGTYVLEFANKRHLKAIARYWLGRQTENPFDFEPYEFVELNVDFHPDYVAAHLGQVGFHIDAERAVSTFRLPALKRYVDPNLLARIDGWLQRPTARLRLTPSIFLRTHLDTPGFRRLSETLWRCPNCNSLDMTETPAAVECNSCSANWPIDDGIYDFKPS
ncbi:MAG: Demethylrebeccamycin-D-glucose O-methyltransferase [Anaerolineales bacterium]|nr:Demethylrebeccamycin-D-glucose O-methyltransferase [Anaerolineales bacterium]